MKQPKLLDVPATAPTKAARVQAFKAKHGIWTHYAPHLAREDERWTAMLIVTARERMKGYGAHPHTTGEAMVAGYCRLLDEMDLMVTGTGEVTTIRRLCARNNIVCDL